MKKCLRFIRTWSVPIVVAISVLCIFRFVLILGYVPSGSMEPTLKTGSFIVGLRIHPEPKVGDIAVFQYGGKVMVKRIAAVGGDVIDHKGELITIPRNHYYMLGDNASDSFDSRYWDDPFVPEGDPAALTALESIGEEFPIEREALALSYKDLPPKRQEMLKLLFVDELSPTEVAERLNCTVQHVYNRRSQALKALKAALGEGGGDL